MKLDELLVLDVERLSPTENARYVIALEEAARREPDDERLLANRGWSAIMLAKSLETCRSILAGKPVPAWMLHGEALRRALRGAPPPDRQAYITITDEMLDAVNEAGPFR